MWTYVHIKLVHVILFAEVGFKPRLLALIYLLILFGFNLSLILPTWQAYVTPT